MDITMDVFGFTNSGSKVKIGEIAKHLYDLGGTVFYVNPSASGASYTFYDSNGDELTVDDSDLSSFANAAYYIKTGTGNADKYFIADNTDAHARGNFYFNYQSINTPEATAIGTGKSNTNTILATTPESNPLSPDLWDYLVNTQNANEVGHCNDWYVPSADELLAFANSIYFPSWWANQEMYISSSQYPSNNNYYLPVHYYNGSKYIYESGKHALHPVIFIRSM